MTYLQKWQKAVEVIAQEYTNLSPDKKKRLHEQVVKLLSVKSDLHDLAERAEGGAACTSCGGKCCVCGRYHFSAIDYVAYLATGKELFQPDFAAGGCPFLNTHRCLMPPEYRPFNCITFVCDEIERKLSLDDKNTFYAMERELRRIYVELQQLFLDPRMRRSMLSFVQDS